MSLHESFLRNLWLLNAAVLSPVSLKALVFYPEEVCLPVWGFVDDSFYKLSDNERYDVAVAAVKEDFVQALRFTSVPYGFCYIPAGLPAFEELREQVPIYSPEGHRVRKFILMLRSAGYRMWKRQIRPQWRFYGCTSQSHNKGSDVVKVTALCGSRFLARVFVELMPEIEYGKLCQEINYLDVFGIQVSQFRVLRRAFQVELKIDRSEYLRLGTDLSPEGHVHEMQERFMFHERSRQAFARIDYTLKGFFGNEALFVS